MSTDVMRNIVGEPVSVGAIKVRAATTHLFGDTAFQGVVQRYQARERWGPGSPCRHRHPDAVSALACAEGRVNEMAATLGGSPR